MQNTWSPHLQHFLHAHHDHLNLSKYHRINLSIQIKRQATLIDAMSATKDHTRECVIQDLNE